MKIDQPQAKWGERVRARRELLGLSQRKLADLCDVGQSAIQFIETGRNIPRDGLKLKLAEALRTTPGQLFPWGPS